MPPVEQLHHLLPKGHSKVWHVILTPIYVSGKQSATVCNKIFMLSSVTASAQSTVLKAPGKDANHQWESKYVTGLVIYIHT